MRLSDFIDPNQWEADGGFRRLAGCRSASEWVRRSNDEYREWALRQIVERILLDRSEITELAKWLGIPLPRAFDEWAAANNGSGQQPADAPLTSEEMTCAAAQAGDADTDPRPVPLEEGLDALRGAGKIPGKNYSWKETESDVRNLRCVGEDERGFSRTSLYRAWKKLPLH